MAISGLQLANQINPMQGMNQVLRAQAQAAGQDNYNSYGAGDDAVLPTFNWGAGDSNFYGDELVNGIFTSGSANMRGLPSKSAVTDPLNSRRISMSGVNLTPDATAALGVKVPTGANLTGAWIDPSRIGASTRQKLTDYASNRLRSGYSTPNAPGGEFSKYFTSSTYTPPAMSDDAPVPVTSYTLDSFDRLKKERPDDWWLAGVSDQPMQRTVSGYAARPSKLGTFGGHIALPQEKDGMFGGVLGDIFDAVAPLAPIVSFFNPVAGGILGGLNAMQNDNPLGAFLSFAGAGGLNLGSFLPDMGSLDLGGLGQVSIGNLVGNAAMGGIGSMMSGGDFGRGALGGGLGALGGQLGANAMGNAGPFESAADNRALGGGLGKMAGSLLGSELAGTPDIALRSPQQQQSAQQRKRQLAKRRSPGLQYAMNMGRYR